MYSIPSTGARCHCFPVYYYFNEYLMLYLILCFNNTLSFINNNNNRRFVTLAEHTSDHGRQTNSSTEEKGEHCPLYSYSIQSYIYTVLTLLCLIG